MYDAALIELLKITVPAYARSWSPTQHEWTIDARYARSLGNAMADPGCVIVGLDPPRQPKRDDTNPSALGQSDVSPRRPHPPHGGIPGDN